MRTILAHLELSPCLESILGCALIVARQFDSYVEGFHMRPGAAIRDLAKRHNVTIEVFDIIYEVVDTLKDQGEWYGDEPAAGAATTTQ